jgi:hypothetical protein
MLVGVLAGLVAFVFAWRFGEPQVDLAIAFEEQMAAAEAPAADAAAAAEEEEAPLVTRETQATTGLATGLVGYGAAIGGIFALVFALAYGRLGGLGARATSALLAAAAFLSVALVPQLKYPANPPAVGFDDTIGARTALFFVFLVLSIALMVGVILLARRLWAERGAWNAGLIAAGAYVAGVAVLFALLPSVNEMPEGFAPLVIWNFRVVSLGIHLILWTVIGLAFGMAAERLLEGRARPGLARA